MVARALGDSAAGVVRTANDRAFRTAIVPAGNVVTTADELSRFYMTLANGGALNGTTVFDPRTISSQIGCAVHRIFLHVSTPAIVAR